MDKSIPRENTLIIIPSLSTGGVELQLVNQLAHLDQQGYNNYLLCVITEETEHLNKIVLDKNKILLLDYPEEMKGLHFSSIKSSYPMAKRIIPFIDKHGIQKIVAILALGHLVGRWVKILRSHIELTVWYRNIESENIGESSLLKSIFYKASNIASRVLDDKAIYISQAVKEDIERNFVIHFNYAVIYNALPRKTVQREPGLHLLVEHQLDIQKHFIILIPGRVKLSQKGQVFFASAFRKFIDKNSPSQPIKVVVAGDGELEELAQQIQNLDLSDHFVLLGKVPNDILLSLFQVCHLVVIPSMFEGFGNVAIEGLQQKANILVSTAGGLDEIIVEGVNGAKFEANNEGDLIRKLEEIIFHDYFRNITDQDKYNSYLERFTIENQMEEIINFLNR